MPAPIKELQKFYQSSAWKKARKAFVALKRGLCNKCGKAGWEVHHVIPLTINNYSDPDIAINFDNLELLCTSCHNAERYKDVYIRSDLEFDSDGNVIKKQQKMQ